jgi:uroporphyrin-III C-methyltransferase/precorrin-2 dehydrogenase/sirohydrochlorin ferrochelatase
VTGPYLAGLRLVGRRVVVVGGGVVAERRIPPLVRAGADLVVIAPAVTAAVEKLVVEVGVCWRRRHYAPGDLDGAWYALALTDDPVVNAQVVADAEAARTFCVRADDGAAGTAVTPALAVDGPVTIGVLGGGDPGRAAAVRDGVLAALRDGRIDTRPHRGPDGPGPPGRPRPGGPVVAGPSELSR